MDEENNHFSTGVVREATCQMYVALKEHCCIHELFIKGIKGGSVVAAADALAVPLACGVIISFVVC